MSRPPRIRPPGTVRSDGREVRNPNAEKGKTASGPIPRHRSTGRAARTVIRRVWAESPGPGASPKGIGLLNRDQDRDDSRPRNPPRSAGGQSGESTVNAFVE